MIETMDTQRALQAVERLQAKLKERGEVPTEEKLSLLKSVLQSPLFHQILALQKSVQQLRDQGNSPVSRGSEIADHATIVKPNGGPAVYPEAPAATHVLGKTPSKGFEDTILSMAQGRHVTHVELEKPPSGGLGFSVVGLKSENRGELGIFIQEIQPGSIAHCDGKLKEADQILAINGQPLDQTVTHQQAIGILQSASARVELTLARGPIAPLASPAVSRTPSAASTISANSTAWQHVETIELVNDGTGLGFGIVGGKTTGVIVKTILPGGIADQDGRLRSGDHILRIGDTDLLGMGSEQVAQVLRQCGNRVKLVVTRGPVDESPAVSAVMPVVLPTVSEQQDSEEEEVETFIVSLAKNSQGLGITIAGYVGDKNSEPSGIFVKSITKDSAVDQDGRIHVGDQIIAVDGLNIQGYTNQQAVEVLRHTGQSVHLKLIRRGFRPDEIPPATAVTPSVTVLPPYTTIPTTAAVLSELELERERSEEEPQDEKLPQTKSDGSDVRVDVGQLTEDKHRLELTLFKEEELIQKWQEILGPSNEVVVAQVEKFSESSGLGISLEANSGHHYIRSVLPEGPVGRCGKLFSGDELLEVNGISLIGETHKEVVRILKELPLCVYMTCCRPTPHLQPDLETEAPLAEGITATLKLFEKQTELVDTPIAENPAATAAAVTQDHVTEEAVGAPLAMWELEVQNIELEKGEGGLGFSILDYQDPMDPAKTVIVIRSLVPGGVAEQDSRLLPGDRLMYVNSTDLENASLEEAVQALKGAALGKVQIGVAKPLPIDTSEAEMPDDKDDSFQASMIALHGSTCSADLDYLQVSTPKLAARLDLVHNHPRFAPSSGLAGAAQTFSPDQPTPFTPHIQDFSTILDPHDHFLSQRPPEDEDLSFVGRVNVLEEAVESLHIQQEDREVCVEEDSDEHVLTPGSSFERTITVVKGNSSLGMTVSAVKDGLGMLIRSIIQGGSISRDGRLGVGDLILAVNGEPTANLSNAQARALLRRHSLIGPDMGSACAPEDDLCPFNVITYVPAEYLEEYKASLEPTQDNIFSESAPAPNDVPNLPEREDGEGEESASYANWNQPRRVELFREPGKSLGISIVGGRGMGSRLSNGEVMRGIFIKHILEDSPAGQNRTLKTGDRIVEVDGVDLRDASHEEAVEAIRKAGNTVTFLVQSIVNRPRTATADSSEERAAVRKRRDTSDTGGDSLSRLFLRPSPTNPFTPTPFKPANPTASLTAAVCVIPRGVSCTRRGRPWGAGAEMGQRQSTAKDLDETPEVLSTISSDDIVQADGRPLCAAEIGSELQKRFAILPGGRGMNGSPIIFLPEFPAFDELEEEELKSVLGYLTSVPSLAASGVGFILVIDRRLDRWAAVRATLLRIAGTFPGNLHLVLVLRPSTLFQRALSDFLFKFNKDEFKMKVVMLSSVTELHAYIDPGQLTTELGGTQDYCHDSWISHRTAIEAFALMVKTTAQALQAFGTELAETELPNDAEATTDLLHVHSLKKDRMKEDLQVAVSQGGRLLDCIKEPIHADPDYNMTCDEVENLATVQRLLGQLDDTEAAFDDFWERHCAKLEQCLQLRHFERHFREVRTLLDVTSERLSGFSEVSVSPAHAEHVLRELCAHEDKACDVLDRALSLACEGDKLIESSHYAEDSIRPKCSELRAACEDVSATLRSKKCLLLRAMELHHALEKASHWCEEGIFLLASQPVDRCQSQEGAEAALQELERYLDTAPAHTLADRGGVLCQYEATLTAQLRDQIEKVFQKQSSVQEMFEKRRVSLKKLAAKQTRPVQPVAPRPEVKSPLSSPNQQRKERRFSADSAISKKPESPLHNGGTRHASLSEEEENLAVLRRHVMNELLETERAYVEELLCVLEGYAAEMDNPAMAHLIPSHLLSKKDVLFGNMPEIYQFHKRTFLKELEAFTDCPELVGRCFLERMKDLQIYEAYCQNKPRSESLWRQCSDCAFFQECQKKLEHKLGLDSYLLKPVQRITKYQLLLKELLKYSKGCDGCNDLQEALTSILGILKAVNDSMHLIAITGYEGNLSELGRLLMQGSFSVWTEHKKGHAKVKDLARFKPMQRHLFLHEKALLFCKRREESGEGYEKAPSYSFKHSLSMSAVGITENAKGDNKKFEIWCNSRDEVFIVQAPTPEIKTSWVSEIRKVLTQQLQACREASQKSSEPLPQSPAVSLSPFRSQKSQKKQEEKRAEPGASPAPALPTPAAAAADTSAAKVKGWSKASLSVDASEENDGYSSGEEPLNSDPEDESGRKLAPGKYTVVADCEKAGPQELSVKSGDVVQLIREAEEGQWFVKNLRSSKEGWVPAANLLSLISESKSSQSLSSSDGSVSGNLSTSSSCSETYTSYSDIKP